MVPIKLGQLLERPKALDTMNNSNNSKDITMGNQQPSFYFKKNLRIEEGSETKEIRSNSYFRPKYPRLDILDKDIVRTTRKLVEISRNTYPPKFPRKEIRS